MNRIRDAFSTKRKILSIYFTAGYPRLEDTLSIIENLEASGVDMVEIGLPFSDPLADGHTIQESSKIALENGMTTKKLFEQLHTVRESVHIPLIIMGYLNPIVKYGFENFCRRCVKVGIDGLIIPDMPLQAYKCTYKSILDKYDLKINFLITPQTSDERMRYISSISNGFVYVVSASSTTGAKSGFSEEQMSYFKRISDKPVSNHRLIGFGIGDKTTFDQATTYADGAIIGSAFINMIKDKGIRGIGGFIRNIRM